MLATLYTGSIIQGLINKGIKVLEKNIKKTLDKKYEMWYIINVRNIAPLKQP